MNLVNTIMMIAMILALVLVCAWMSLPKRTLKKGSQGLLAAAGLFVGLTREILYLPVRQWRKLAGTPRMALANIAEGTHAGNIRKLADAAIATRFLLAKIGTDIDHVAAAGVGDIALGVITDEAAAAEDEVNVALLGSSKTTLKAVASAAIAAGDLIVPAANGKVRTLPVAAGTYYIVGRALQAAAADTDVIEFDPTLPIQRVVA